MGREKSGLHSKDKVLGKNSAQCQSKTRSTKGIKNKKELEEKDSLTFLKDSKDIKKVNALDERIKLLKSELKMLLGESKSENTDHECISGVVCQNLPGDKCDQKKSLVLEPDKATVAKSDSNAGQSQNLAPTKFSTWLDKTIDEITENSKNSNNQREFSQCNDLVANSKPQITSTFDRFSAPESSSKLACANPSSPPHQEVEQLLYKSFYLQNFEIYLSSSDENDVDQIKSTKPLKQNKRQTRRPLTSNKKSPYRSYKSSHRTRRKRTVAKVPSKSKVDVLCKSASDNNCYLREKNVELVELDLTDCDWSEPFEIDDHTGVLSDVEILEDPREERTDFCEQTRGSRSKPVEYDLNISTDKLDNDRSKKAWECPICFEMSKGQEVVATQCGHIFCKKCLERYMVELNKNCPTCRTDLSNKPTITLFNF